MSLSVEDVAKVALLARFGIEPNDLATFTAQINSIVDYVAQLQELDTTDVEPLAHGIELRNVFRDDVRGPALDREKALANAPQRNQSSFLVPAVLEYHMDSRPRNGMFALRHRRRDAMLRTSIDEQ